MRNVRRAFTIVETLTALALLVLLIGTIFYFMTTIAERRDRVVGLASSTRDVVAMLDQLEADLLTAVTADPSEGTGISGDGASIRVVFRAVWLRGALGADAPRDVQGASYTFDQASESVLGERWAPGVEAGRNAGAGTDGLSVALCRGVGKLGIRYFDGSTWAASFDSVARGGLPAAVEIKVWSAGSADEGSEPAWMRTIRVPDGGVSARAGGIEAAPIEGVGVSP